MSRCNSDRDNSNRRRRRCRRRCRRCCCCNNSNRRSNNNFNNRFGRFNNGFGCCGLGGLGLWPLLFL